MKTSYSQYTNTSRLFGFTLLELIVSISLIAILVGIAAPSFASMLARSQLRTQTHQLIESLYLARNHALTEQTIVHICQLNKESTTQCGITYNSNRSWSHGWLVFADINGNNNFDGNDRLIRSIKMPDTINIVFNQRGRLRFFPDGSSRSAGFYLCDRDKQLFRHVYLLHTGRARVNEKLSARQKSKCKNKV